MTSRLTLSVPATLTVLGGNASLSSLDGTGPGIVVGGAGAAETIALVLSAGNSAAVLGVANTAGAAVTAAGNTLSLTGTAAEVNAALATLRLTEPADAGGDVLRLAATATAAVAAESGFTVAVVPPTGPAFVAPPQTLTLPANALTPIPGLRLADPIAQGLAAMGLGAAETLSLTLSVAEGVLLLPGQTAQSGIAAQGLGTGTIELTLAAGEIGALNSVLAGLEFFGPASTQPLNYALWNAAGVLPRSVTYGAITLNTQGSAVAGGVVSAGNQTLLAGGTVFAGTLGVSGITSVLGTLGGGALALAPGTALQMPATNYMSLSGTSLDFGALSGQWLDLSGTLLLGGAGSFAGAVSLAAGARLQIEDGLTAFGTAASSFDTALHLAPGALVEGSGTVTAGNFSQSGVVAGGTLLALGGETLEIDASTITGGALLQAAGGGVMVLGPVSPLFGIFDTTPLTVDSSVTLGFLGAGAAPIGGGYAGTLGGAGGAFVIAGPQYFSGTVTGFREGDALIFPDLANISLYNIGTAAFSMAGTDGTGKTVTYTIHTSIASGYAPAVGLDAQGDEEVFLRPPHATVSQGAALAATAGTPQPLLGTSINIANGTTQALALTLSATLGHLSEGAGSASSVLVLTASGIGALNAELAAVSYSGTGVADTVVFTSNTGLLAGLQGDVTIAAAAAGTVSAYAGLGVSQAEMVVFGPAVGLPQITSGMAVGGIAVSGTADFEGVLHGIGYSGTGLIADGGGEAIFGAAAAVSLAGNMTLGDQAGAGTLLVLSDDFHLDGAMILGQAAGGAGAAAAVLGTMSLTGGLAIGAAAAAGMVVEGGVAGGALSLGAAGSLQALGTARLAVAGITNSGTILLGDATVAEAAAYQGAGTLALGGTALLAVAGAVQGTGLAPAISIGTGATLRAGSFTALIGTVYDAGLLAVSGSAVAGALTLAGGTLAAQALAADGTLAGAGVIAASVVVNGTLAAAGGRLLVTGAVQPAGQLDIGAGAVLEIGGTLGGAASFTGANAELVLDVAAASPFTATGMTVTDAIDLIGIAPGLVVLPTVSGGTGVILDSAGNTASQFGLVASGPVAPQFSVVSDGAGGSLITLDGQLPCFARGTGILGPHGYRPVESLRPNDPVITANGERRPVRWIGWRTLDLGTDAASAARPVLILPDAFAPGQPAKLLRLSPSHCVYAGGVLIPVTHLVNGATILRERGRLAATYFHIELDRHDILLAEGLPCESYFDDGNRAAMVQALGRRCPARRPYAPVVTGGAKLAMVRARLHARALAAGFAARFQPSLRGVAGGQSALAEMTRLGETRVAQLRFTAPVRELVLLCATACPADTDPESEDQRALGVCLGRMRGVTLTTGWLPRAPGDTGTWMGARAALTLQRPRREVRLALTAVMPRWFRDGVGKPQGAMPLF